MRFMHEREAPYETISSLSTVSFGIIGLHRFRCRGPNHSPIDCGETLLCHLYWQGHGCCVRNRSQDLNLSFSIESVKFFDHILMIGAHINCLVHGFPSIISKLFLQKMNGLLPRTMLLSHLRGDLLILHVQPIESRHRVPGLLELFVAVRYIHVLAFSFFGPNDLELDVSFRHRDDDVFVCVEKNKWNNFVQGPLRLFSWHMLFRWTYFSIWLLFSRWTQCRNDDHGIHQHSRPIRHDRFVNHFRTQIRAWCRPIFCRRSIVSETRMMQMENA